MELLTATSGYRRFMERQIDLLQDGDQVLDLGCGTGDFGVVLSKREKPPSITITSVDYVRNGLERGRERIASLERVEKAKMRYVLANLELREKRCIPLGSQTFDAVLASLLVSYIEDPAALLGSVLELLRPGGRLVLSAPKRDARKKISRNSMPI